MNKLYYGDNLDIIRKYISDESVDLIYLDPPFNSQRAYNVIFQDKTGKDSSAQIQAFEDSWSWSSETQTAYDEIMTSNYPTELKDMMKAFKEFMGTSNLMAYLTMMAIRLVELKRVLKSTGSIYLHCDPTASHYLKILLDQIFGIKDFRSEIIWQRTSSHNDSQRWPHIHDVIFFYAGNGFVWNPIYLPHNPKYIEQFYKYSDQRGQYRLHEIIRTASMGPRPNLSYDYKGYKPEWGWRMIRSKVEALDKDGRIEWSSTGRPYLKRYLKEQEGTLASSIWPDIPPLSGQSGERLGFATQKPIALLERIIQASSNEGDTVLDPFCGCGTAVVAAEKLGRNWIGIDITHLAIALIKKRISDHFPDAKFTVIGEPRSVEDAKTLFEASAFQFESWAVSLLGGQPYKSKGGGDSGIDGLLYFKDYEGKFHRIIIEVKGGGYHPKEVRALKAVIDREEAPIGVLLALNPPTKGMISEAAALGKWKMPGSKREYPILQIITIEDIFSGKLPALPDTSETLKTAARTKRTRQQGKLL
jgi:site-specific DNA-methyltransferase (adenine-specific)